MFPLQIQTISRSVYTPEGLAIKEPNLNSSTDSIKKNAILADEYFRKINDFPISPGMAAAGVEIIGAEALRRCFPGPATWVNLLTTIGETASVAVSGVNFKDKQFLKDGFLAWFQIGAGLFGLGGFVKETFITKKDEHDFSEIPVWEKIALSAASTLNVLSMASGAIEKSLLSMVCKNAENEKENEARSSLTSAVQDRRCILEWLAMATLVPWFSNIGPIKKLLDILIPYQAIREGLDSFIEKPDTTLILGKKLSCSSGFQDAIKKIRDPRRMFMKVKDEKEKYHLCSPFHNFTKFLIGTESDKNGPGTNGLRNYLLKPIFKFLRCQNVPTYFLADKNNIVVEFEEKVAKQKEITQEQKEQPATKDEKAKATEGSKTLGTKTATA